MEGSEGKGGIYSLSVGLKGYTDPMKRGHALKSGGGQEGGRSRGGEGREAEHV